MGQHPIAQHCRFNRPSSDETKTLLDYCRCAQAFIDEHDLGDGLDVGERNVMRVSAITLLVKLSDCCFA